MIFYLAIFTLNQVRESQADISGDGSLLVNTEESNNGDSQSRNRIPQEGNPLREQKLKEKMELYYKERVSNPDPKLEKGYFRRDTRTTMAQHKLIHFGWIIDAWIVEAV